MKSICALFAFAGVYATLLAAEKNWAITIEAGDYDRRDTVVEFKLPSDAQPTSLLTSEGKSTALQLAGGDRAWFIERELKRGAAKTYTLSSGGAQQLAQAQRKDDSVTLRVFGKTAMVYRTEKTPFPAERTDLKPIFQRGGYIHPVLSPSGAQITDDYPVNHKHHHGIWFAWTHTEFQGRTPDFWNMGDGKGTVEFVSLDDTWSGPVHAGFRSKHRQVDLSAPEPVTALNETWNVKLFAVGNNAAQPYFLFDVEVTDACATNAAVKLPEYRYGGIGVRGNWAWNGKDALNFLNDAGSTDRSKGDKSETRGRWAHMGGLVEGKLTGIGMLSHPQNPHTPEPMRIHPTEPFFNFAPQQAGDMEIAPGKPLTLRYRFVASDGAPDKTEIDRLWNDYAHPPKVTVAAK